MNERKEKKEIKKKGDKTNIPLLKKYPSTGKCMVLVTQKEVWRRRAKCIWRLGTMTIAKEREKINKAAKRMLKKQRDMERHSQNNKEKV